MSQVKLTDEAIEVQLRSLDTTRAYGLTASEELLERALLELKRMRAWAKCGIAIGAPQDQREALRNILNDDPAPSDEQEKKQ